MKSQTGREGREITEASYYTRTIPLLFLEEYSLNLIGRLTMIINCLYETTAEKNKEENLVV